MPSKFGPLIPSEWFTLAQSFGSRMLSEVKLLERFFELYQKRTCWATVTAFLACMQETFMKVFLHQMGFGARPEYTHWAANNTHACSNTCFLVYLYGYLSTLIFLVSTGRRTGGEFLPFFDGLRQNRCSRPARPNECRFASYCRRTGIPHRLRTATARS